MNIADLSPEAVEAAWPHLTDQERAEIDALLADVIPDDLPGFYAVANPGYMHPEHLYGRGIDKDGKPARSLGETIEATIEAPQKASFSTPPQFGKTIFILCGIAWYAHRVPGSVSAYVSYNDDVALSKSDEFRKMAKAAGLKPTGPKSCITLRNGSQVLFTSWDGPLEGKPVTGQLVLDDPYKSRADAESPAVRKQVAGWFFSTALGRTHPRTSIIVIAHRWTVDDLIAEIDEKGWPWSNYPAIWPDGRSLWEPFKPLAFLLVRRGEVGPFTWESEYQGNPTAKGGRVFEGVSWYVPEGWELDDLRFTTKGAPKGETIRLPPRRVLRLAIGVDLAYTEKTSSDWSVAVVMGEYDANWYVLEALRRQVKADAFATELKQLSAKYPGAPMRWDGSTTERGSADVIRTLGKVPLQSVLTTEKPFGRSQLVGAAWRRGAVHVPDQNLRTPQGMLAFPEACTWVPEYVRILTTFVGGDGAEDDDVVATASAFAQLPARPVKRFPVHGSPEWIAEQDTKGRELAIQRVRDAIRQKNRAARGASR